MSTQPTHRLESIQEVSVTREGLEAARSATVAEVGTWSSAKRTASGVEEAYQATKHLDPVQINLSKLERLSPGSSVTLEGERYEVHGLRTVYREGVPTILVSLSFNSCEFPMPLLKAAVEGGQATVQLAGEPEGGREE